MDEIEDETIQQNDPGSSGVENIPYGNTHAMYSTLGFNKICVETKDGLRRGRAECKQCKKILVNTGVNRMTLHR